MTLNDMSAEYRQSAELLSKRLAELRGLLKEAKDPEEIWHIKRRINELTPMLTEANELAWLLAHYYDKGGERCDRYAFNGIRRRRGQKTLPKKDHDENSAGRTYRSSATDISSTSFSGNVGNADCQQVGDLQKLSMSYLTSCGEQSPQGNEISLGVSDIPDSILDSFFREAIT